MRGSAGDGLSRAIVDCARLMRHDGMRVVVSTQSPLALAPELLELVSLALLHRFHSADWMEHLGRKMVLGREAWGLLPGLAPGQAVAFASRHRLPPAMAMGSGTGGGGGQQQQRGEEGTAIHNVGGGHTFLVAVRPRLTADRGASRTNAGGGGGGGSGGGAG